LHYKARYQDRRRAIGRDVELCFSGKITISRVGLHAPWLPADEPPAG
jgi:hypothetical protein